MTSVNAPVQSLGNEKAFEGNTSQQLRFLSQIANNIGAISNGKDGNNSEKEKHVEKEKKATQLSEQVIGTERKPIVVPTEKLLKNFKEALLGCNGKIPREEYGVNQMMKRFKIPRYEGGNLVIDLDKEDYKRGVEELKYNVVGRLFLTKGCEHPTTMELKNKLAQIWGVPNFKIVPLGGGYFHIIQNSMSDQSTEMSSGLVNTSPGTFRVSQWHQGF